MGKIGKSTYAGKCTAGKHDIAVGQDNYYEKINEKWVRCSDLECFKSQGGSYDPNAKSYPQKKVRTIEERMTESKQMVEFCWKLAKAKAQEEYAKRPEIEMSIEEIRNRSILSHVLFKGIVEDWVR